MARLNIEDSLFIDIRFRKLVRILGNEDQALGMLIRFWQTAQKRWGQFELIPLKEFELGDFGPLVECCFAEIRPDGVYAKGAEKEFSWYRKTCEKSKKGGQANKAKLGKISLGDSPGDSPGDSLGDSPLTLTLTPTQNNYSGSSSEKAEFEKLPKDLQKVLRHHNLTLTNLENWAKVAGGDRSFVAQTLRLWAAEADADPRYADRPAVIRFNAYLRAQLAKRPKQPKTRVLEGI